MNIHTQTDIAFLVFGVLDFVIVGVCLGCLFCFGVGCLGGHAKLFFLKSCTRNLRITNRQNTGLISVDRRTSLLSHVQYPVLSKSSTKDLSLSVPERRLNLVLGRSLSLRVNTESGYIVAFQHRF